VLVTSLGFRTDLALRVREGAEVVDRGDYLVIRTADNPGFWWGTSSCSAGRPDPARLPPGEGYARYQHAETDPAARRLGLAGTLFWRAGRYGREVLGAGTLVIVADPADAAIRIYRSCGFAGLQGQLTLERPSAVG
jgi:GNAT superfamily N-acetyltransferase